jgi:hypothetical protein
MGKEKLHGIVWIDGSQDAGGVGNAHQSRNTQNDEP